MTLSCVDWALPVQLWLVGWARIPASACCCWKWAALTQMDRLSINAIPKTYASLRRRGGTLNILCASSRIYAVLKLGHLLDFIPSFEDEAEALASFRPLGYSAKP